MLKNMLKGILAIATVCVMSTPAYADFSSWIGSNFGSHGGTLTSDYYGKFIAKMSGESTTFEASVSYTSTSTDNQPTSGDTYVKYKFNDTVSMTLGKFSVADTWGKISSGSWCMGCGAPVWAGTGIGATYVFAATGIGVDIALGDGMRVHAGALNNSGTLKPYANIAGSAGSLSYAANYMSEGGMAASVGFDLGDAIKLGADIVMPSATGSNMGTGVGAKFIDLGPGTLAATVAMAGSTSWMEANYQIVLEPGKFMDIYYRNTTASYMGVSFFALF